MELTQESIIDIAAIAARAIGPMADDAAGWARRLREATVGVAAAFDGIEEEIAQTLASVLPRKELPGVVVSIDPAPAKRGGRSGETYGYAHIVFQASIGNGLPENIYLDVRYPDGSPVVGADEMVKRVQSLVGQRVRIVKEGHPIASDPGKKRWKLFSIEPTDTQVPAGVADTESAAPSSTLPSDAWLDLLEAADERFGLCEEEVRAVGDELAARDNKHITVSTISADSCQRILAALVERYGEAA